MGIISHSKKQKRIQEELERVLASISELGHSWDEWTEARGYIKLALTILAEGSSYEDTIFRILEKYNSISQYYNVPVVQISDQGDKNG